MIILAGPPGSGKGTQAELLVQDGYRHISTGEILRRASETDATIAATLAEGKLVPNEVMSTHLEAVLPDDHSRIVLEGAPREPAGTVWLKSWLARHPHGAVVVIILAIDDKTSFERVMARARPDDTEEAIRTRQDQYRRLTVPALADLTPPFKSFTLDGSLPIELLHTEIQTIIQTIFKDTHEDAS